jgi:hypothetical protein
MSAKKKSAGKGAKRAKAAKTPKKRVTAAKARAGAAKRGGAKRAIAKSAKKKPVAKKSIVRKLAAKKPVKAKAASAKAKPAAVKRRDGAGHLDPKYAADLRERLRAKPKKDDERAFAADELSEELGEEFVETVTSGEDEGNELRDKRVTEELGGPFTVTTGGTEFAGGVDASNPKRATREPFPRT